MKVCRLVIGDHFAAQFQLTTDTQPNGYDITSATRFAATVVNEDHSKRLCSVIDQAPTEDDQLNVGQITVQLASDVTEQMRPEFPRVGFAHVELKVEILGKEFTWWHDLEVVPGYIP